MSETEQPRLVLASGSPRRAEILRRLSLHFEVDPAHVDERYVESEYPGAYAERLAREKAITVARRHPGATVIGSDTVVVLGKEVLGKPGDERGAVEMLCRLSGRVHQVHTGVAVVFGEDVVSALERVRVHFRELTRTECEEYVATGEPLDKAGAYGIQGYGGALVERIEGDFFAVMGLPIVRTLRLLEEAGWKYSFARGLGRV